MSTYKSEDYIYAGIALAGFASVIYYVFKVTKIDEEAYDIVEQEWKKLNR